MSTAFYPLGMVSYNNSLPQGGYKSWKGSGVLSNPIGTTASNIRPLTNKDPGNIFQTGPGLARPIKHYRKGRVIAIPPITNNIYNPPIVPTSSETALVNYNLNRFVKSSRGASLGGGAGGMGLVSQIIQNPGQTSFNINNVNEVSNIDTLDANCKTCKAVGLVSSYYPNNTYITENPIQPTMTPTFCCNPQKKALKRVLPASTILKKNYYTTLQQYRQNRCKTFEQRSFNFITPEDVLRENTQLNNGYVTEAAIRAAKPGGPLLTSNTYFANCQPNGELYQSLEINIISRFAQIIGNQSILSSEQINQINSYTTLSSLYQFIKSLPVEQKEQVEKIYIQFVTNPYIGIPITGPTNPIGCKLVVYKPNNSQYAKQGAVMSSVKNLKLNVTTIEKNLATFNYRNSGRKQGYTDQMVGNSTTIPFILKNKAPPCLQQTYLGKFQNPKTCFKNQNDYMNKYYNSSNFGTTAPTYYDSVYV
jgi:hypothetical protein